MAGFLYYVSGHQGTLSLDGVRNLGLGYAFDAAPSCANVEGPDGKRGTVFAALDRAGAPPLGYNAKTQTWRRVPRPDKAIPAAQVWVGSVMDDPPTPSILGRPAMLDGYPVTLPDGNQWLVPVARRYADDAGEVGWYMTLPRYLDYTDDGKFVEGGVQRQYQRLWATAEEFVKYMGETIQQVKTGDPMQLDLQAHFRDAVTAVQTNYYVAEVELAMLGALSTESATQIMLTLIDWFTFQDIIDKKKLSEAASSEPGSSGDVTGTAPPLAK